MDINQLAYIFYEIDNFCKAFSQYREQKLLPAPSLQGQRGPKCCLSDSEIMTIIIAFQFSITGVSTF